LFSNIFASSLSDILDKRSINVSIKAKVANKDILISLEYFLILFLFLRNRNLSEKEGIRSPFSLLVVFKVRRNNIERIIEERAVIF